ncbi:Gti1/Pac2 family-domain-containing protein [Infundibulicybe gibba]|nr:Gti1/Pac2 family-domain-containing protein [Infundibulicybe gibba]
MQQTQLPTCKDTRIRSTHDAHKIFFAVQQGLLHMVTRRLDADERQALCSGCVYAWEERGPHTEITGLGIERFTEGRRWSPSRVRDEFLFYYEKYSPPTESGHQGTATAKHPPRDWDPLVKQTYSVWVETEKGRRKWHLTAYFTQATVDQLGTIDDFKEVRDLVVPDGLFKSTRVGKQRHKTDDQPASRSNDVLKVSTSGPRSYAPFPVFSRETPQSESPPGSILMYEPYPVSQPGHHQSESQSPAYSAPSPLPNVDFSLPPIRDAAVRERPMEYSSDRRIDPQRTTDHISRSYPSQAPDRPYYSSAHYSADPYTSRVQQPVYLGTQENPSQSIATSWYDTPNQGLYRGQQLDYEPTSHVTAPQYISSAAVPIPVSATYQNGGQGFLRSHSQQTNERILPRNTSPHLPEPRNYQTQPESQTAYLPPLAVSQEIPASYELLSVTADSPGAEGRRSSSGPCRDLAPLNTLARPHPYRRDPVDDRALRLLGPRSS